MLCESLPVPGIDFLEDFPLLTLAVANLELGNSFRVPLGGLSILPFVVGGLDPKLEPMLRIINNEQGNRVN